MSLFVPTPINLKSRTVLLRIVLLLFGCDSLRHSSAFDMLSQFPECNRLNSSASSIAEEIDRPTNTLSCSFFKFFFDRKDEWYFLLFLSTLRLGISDLQRYILFRDSRPCFSTMAFFFLKGGKLRKNLRNELPGDVSFWRFAASSSAPSSVPFEGLLPGSELSREASAGSHCCYV